MRFPSMIAVVAAALALACNTAKLTPRPDASPGCADPQPEYPCQALDGGGPGCSGDLGSGAVLGRDVVVDGTYPGNCTIIVNDPVPDDQNQCRTLGTCRCDADGGVYAWICFK